MTDKEKLFELSMLKMESNARAAVGDPPVNGLVMTSEHAPLWNGTQSSFFPSEVSFTDMMLF